MRSFGGCYLCMHAYCTLFEDPACILLRGIHGMVAGCPLHCGTPRWPLHDRVRISSASILSTAALASHQLQPQVPLAFHACSSVLGKLGIWSSRGHRECGWAAEQVQCASVDGVCLYVYGWAAEQARCMSVDGVCVRVYGWRRSWRQTMLSRIGMGSRAGAVS